jgi:hypothetical protein
MVSSMAISDADPAPEWTIFAPNAAPDADIVKELREVVRTDPEITLQREQEGAPANPAIGAPIAPTTFTVKMNRNRARSLEQQFSSKLVITPNRAVLGDPRPPQDELP